MKTYQLFVPFALLALAGCGSVEPAATDTPLVETTVSEAPLATILDDGSDLPEDTRTTDSVAAQAPVNTLYDMSLPDCDRVFAAIPTEDLEDYTIDVLSSMVMTSDEALWFLYTDEALLISPDGNQRGPTLSMTSEYNRLRDAGGDTTTVRFERVEGQWICTGPEF